MKCEYLNSTVQKAEGLYFKCCDKDPLLFFKNSYQVLDITFLQISDKIASVAAWDAVAIDVHCCMFALLIVLAYTF